MERQQAASPAALARFMRKSPCSRHAGFATRAAAAYLIVVRPAVAARRSAARRRLRQRVSEDAAP
jgi:hypothetical protein